MNSNSQAFSFDRLSRIPGRLQHDKEIVRLLKNWREFLWAKLKGSNATDLYFRNGFVLHSPPEVNLSFVFHEVWLDRIYDQKGYEIEEADLVVDIGANIGVFTVFAADKAKRGKVFAFEPFPANFKFLHSNVTESRLENVSVFQKAVAETNKMRHLIVSDEWIKHSLDIGTSNTDATAKSIDIQSISLEEVLQNEEACDLLKIDCEGSEYEILYPCSPKTIKKIRRIVGEYHEVDSNEMNGKSLIKFLEKSGFAIDCFYPLDESCGVFRARQIYS